MTHTPSQIDLKMSTLPPMREGKSMIPNWCEERFLVNSNISIDNVWC